MTYQRGWVKKKHIFSLPALMLEADGLPKNKEEGVIVPGCQKNGNPTLFRWIMHFDNYNGLLTHNRNF